VLAQQDLREFVIDVNGWDAYSPQEIVDILAEGLARDDVESKALALAGMATFALAAPDLIRTTVGLDSIRSYFVHSDLDVARNSMLTYQLVAPADADAEQAIVDRARSGGGPLEDWQYIRYLRSQGITSAAARNWLLELAEGPTSATRFEAASALIRGLEMPPESLLSIVMELIRSPEYFCHPNLTQHVPKFGASAVQYLGELRELRVVLLNRVGTPAGRRPSGQALRQSDVELLEKAIAAIEN
jgi:hypothetical protein